MRDLTLQQDFLDFVQSLQDDDGVLITIRYGGRTLELSPRDVLGVYNTSAERVAEDILDVTRTQLAQYEEDVAHGFLCRGTTRTGRPCSAPYVPNHPNIHEWLGVIPACAQHMSEVISLWESETPGLGCTNGDRYENDVEDDLVAAALEACVGPDDDDAFADNDDLDEDAGEGVGAPEDKPANGEDDEDLDDEGKVLAAPEWFDSKE